MNTADNVFNTLHFSNWTLVQSSDGVQYSCVSNFFNVIKSEQTCRTCISQKFPFWHIYWKRCVELDRSCITLSKLNPNNVVLVLKTLRVSYFQLYSHSTRHTGVMLFKRVVSYDAFFLSWKNVPVRSWPQMFNSECWCCEAFQGRATSKRRILLKSGLENFVV